MPATNTKGFTLIESVIAIIIMGVAMVSLTSFLFPQIQDSARAHYEVRASALAHSLMTEVLARSYDENSDADGGIIRCGEDGVSCSGTIGPDSDELDGPGDPITENFDDVDDYHGCWYTNDSSKTLCASSDTQDQAGILTDILGADIKAEYANFVADINVESGISVGGSSQFKRVTLKIYAGSYGSIHSFVAYRGNY